MQSIYTQRYRVFCAFATLRCIDNAPSQMTTYYRFLFARSNKNKSKTTSYMTIVCELIFRLYRLTLNLEQLIHPNGYV